MIRSFFRLPAIAVVIAAMLSLQCKSNLAQTRRAYDSLAQSLVGKPYAEHPSPGKRYNLVESTHSATDTPRNYAVIRKENNEVVLKGKYNPGGYVRWLGDDRIELFSVPRNVESIIDSALYKQEIFLETPK